MRIAVAQLNPVVGDLLGNLELILDAARKAAEAGAELLVCPELAICGYPPKDLLLRGGFIEQCDRAIQDLANRAPESLAILVGHPTHRGLPSGGVANGASMLFEGRVETTVHKRLLPNYDVFDEWRYFRPGGAVTPVLFKGLRLGVHICEDAWWGTEGTGYHQDPIPLSDPVAELVEQGVDLLINLSASPFEIDKPDRRARLVQRHVTSARCPFLFVNQVGGNDDLVFDGNSFVTSADGVVVQRLASFSTDLQVVDTEQLPTEEVPYAPPREQLIVEAITLGLRDYMAKSGFRECVLGLSGGIDSALAAYLAARAVGPDKVHGILMPSRYSSDHSVADARDLAEKIGMDWKIVPIDPIHKQYEQLPIIDGDLTGPDASLTEQNLQARIRGAIVMTRSNRYGWLALATGNKSELAVGYCTLYGDMCGGFAVLSDLLKRDVYGVSRYVNDVLEKREVIPVSTLTKAPSAELAPNQTDQDTLPEYDVLDGILEGLVEREESVRQVSERYPLETVQWVLRRLDRNEFKRRQLAPGIKLSARAFGSGRRMPMAARIGVD